MDKIWKKPIRSDYMKDIGAKITAFSANRRFAIAHILILLKKTVQSPATAPLLRLLFFCLLPKVGVNLIFHKIIPGLELASKPGILCFMGYLAYCLCKNIDFIRLVGLLLHLQSV